MPINFHDEKNRRSYATRKVDPTWKCAMGEIVNPLGLLVADIGCGGGIYSRALADLGAERVIGLDSSKVMVDAAREHSSGVPNASFAVGDATATGLEDASVDLVCERALIHHLSELEPAMAEAHRILTPSGHLIVQDRTPEDVGLPGSSEHIRGYFFERFPRLLAIDQGRRWSGDKVRGAMATVGFGNVTEETIWETRRVYSGFPELAEDLRNRTGRSILHELTDTELDHLVQFIGSKLPHDRPIVERDRWTLWVGTRENRPVSMKNA